MYLHYLDILNAALSFLSFLVLLVHWLKNQKASLPNFLFRIFLLANAHLIIVSSLIQNHAIYKLPHLYRTGSISGFLLAPLVYLIINKSLKKKSWNWQDYLHLIPALLYTVDFLPFFILSGDTKRQLLQQLPAVGTAVGFKEGWLLPGSAWQILRIFHLVIYSFSGYLLVKKYVTKNGASFIEDNRKLIILFYWLCIYLFLYGFSITVLVSNIFPKDGILIVTLILSISSLVSYLYLFLNPEVLYGLKGMWVIIELPQPAAPSFSDIALTTDTDAESSLPQEQQQADTLLKEPITRKIYLNQIQVTLLEDALVKYMNESKAFLNPGFSLPQMAKETGQPLQNISAFVNQHIGENFNDFVNRYRVNHLIGIYENDESIAQRLTLEALGKKAGFGSRSTFISAFKKVTGQTPSAYFRN
jgi:AraC-like DNA-binding protein